MITLNGERGFETVESWDDIIGIPGFVESLDPEEHTLKEIIGRYLFKEYISCGLSNCRQPHGRGYIVTTKSNFVTNIGNGCGKTHFGVEFQEQTKIFERALTEHNNREKLATFIFQLDGNAELIALLRSKPKGADWVYKTTRALLQKGKGCPEAINEKIHEFVRNRSGSISVSREATEDEIKDMEAFQNKTLKRPQYIDEVKGNLQGIEALYKENDIRNIIIKDLEENINTISEIDIDTATFKELQHWAKWASEFDNKIDVINKTISYGNKLLNKDNLLQLLVVLDSPLEEKEYDAWLTKYLK